MGCSTSKNAVESIDTNIQKPTSATASMRSNLETLERNDSTSCNMTYPPAEAFVIPLNDQEDIDAGPDVVSNINIKQPPKRLQQLMTQTSTLNSPKKIEDLQEKLERADARRQQYMQQKLESIQKTTQMAMRNSESKGEGEHKSDENPKNIIATSLDDDSKQALLNPYPS